MPTNHPNEHTTIIIQPSSWKARSYDAREEEKARRLIREQVLLKRNEAYYQVRATIKCGADGAPERIVAFMLRANSYTADVVEIRTDSSYSLVGLREGADVADADDDEPLGSRDYGLTAEYADFDMVCATPVPDIPTARDAVVAIAALAQAAGLRVKTLLGAEASVAAYRSALASGIRAFVNVGHGYTGGIVLADGNLTSAWFSGLAGRPVSPAVVYFNSCQVFNPPLEPAVMAGGARTFIGGIVNLLIGPSERVCRSFWQQILERSVEMGTALTTAERENYPSAGAHGIAGDQGAFGIAAQMVVIYEHNDYRGRSRALGVGRYDLAQIGLPNDSLSSLRVPQGFKVNLFQHAGFGGNSVTFTGDSPSVGSFNDKTSSIVIEQVTAAPSVDIFEHADFGGMRKQLGVGRYNLADIGLPNDCLSSMRVARGLKVTLYQHINFTGASVSYLHDTSYVGSFNDVTSSIVVEPATARYVEIFEHADFRGTCKLLGSGSYDVGDLGIGNDALSSLRVPAGMEVTLYQHAHFQGASVRYTRDTSNVGSFNDKTSSIRVRSIRRAELGEQPRPTDGQQPLIARRAGLADAAE